MIPQQISPLEKALQYASRTPHPSPVDKTILPVYCGPWFDIGRAAVETLVAPGDIVQFLQEYTAHICKNHNLTPENAARSAREVVGYCTGYVDDEQANRWFSALADIKHPVTGRKRPFVLDDVDAFYARAVVKNRKEGRRIIARLEDRLPEWFTAKEEKAEEGVVLVRIMPISPPWKDTASTYLFLTGIAQGVAASLESERWHPRITIEYIERSSPVH